MFALSVRVKSLGFTALFFAFVVLGLPSVLHSASGAKDPTVRFRWAFGALVGGGETTRSSKESIGIPF